MRYFRLTWLASLLCAGTIFGSTLHFMWDQSTDPATKGYWLWKSVSTEPFNKVMAIPRTNEVYYQSLDTNSQRYYITATNEFAAESLPSNIVTNLVIILTNTPPPVVPGTPEIIYVNRITGSRIDVGWATKDLTSMSQVWRSMEGQEWRQMATLGPANLHWSDTSAQQRKSYSYMVRSCISLAGCSPFSAAVTYPAK